ncbi:unnamed protein product [Cunninghamella blakesleeana]
MTYKKSHTCPKIDARSATYSSPSLEINDQSLHQNHDIQSSTSCPSPATEPPLSRPSTPLSSSSSTTAAHRPASSPSSIDYRLYEAMINNRNAEEEEEENSNHEVPSSLGSMISLDGDELAQKIDVIEQLETISFLRIIYLGVASLDEKRLLLKKLSDGLSETLFRQTPITSPSTHFPNLTPSSNNNYDFYERKHNLFPLNVFKSEDVNIDYSGLLNDNGVVIVEADFTHDNSTQQYLQPYYDMDFILNYIYIQSISSHSTSLLQSILSPPDHWKSKPFNGHLFSDNTPTGIDLCVYFYHDAESQDEVTKDLEILWKIHALNIPILPILSMSNQKPLHQNAETFNTPITSLTSPIPTTTIINTNTNTNTNDYNNNNTNNTNTSTNNNNITNNDKYTNQRPVGIRRNDLASIFSKWKIKMIDISDLDIIGQPSFNQKGKTKIGKQDNVLEEKLGTLWANSSILTPTPYHILTIIQFMVIDRWAISKVLKTINDLANDRKNGKYKDDKDNGSISLEIESKNNGNKYDNSDNNDDNSSSHETMKNDATSAKEQESTIHTSSFNYSSSSSLLTQNTLLIPSSENTYHEGKDKPLAPSSNYHHNHHSHHQHHSHQHPTSKSKLQPNSYLKLVCLITLISTMLYLIPQNYRKVDTQSQWKASLAMISHQKGKTINFMVSIYDTNDKPSWAPEVPLLSTNLPFVTSKTKLTSHTSISSDIYPLPNNSDTTQGQYLYSISLPPCGLLNPHLHYVIQVKHMTSLFKSNSSINGSPFYLSKKLVCDGSQTIDSPTDTWFSQYIEMIQHFRQHTLMYIVHSAKIFDASLDDSIFEDN